MNEETSIIKNVLGKQAAELSLGDIEGYFCEARYESDQLEFKSGEVRVNDLAREVCAFLNTQGGLIIVGSPRDQYLRQKGGRGEPFCRGALSYSKYKEADWLQEQLMKAIQPKPEARHLQVFAYPASGKAGNVFLIEVQKAFKNPYQLEDGRFYYRDGTSVRPMTYSMVQEAFLAKRSPVYKSSIVFDDAEGLPANQLNINISIRNFSPISPADTFTEVFLYHTDEEWFDSDVQQTSRNGGRNFLLKDGAPLFDERERRLEIRLRHFFKPFYFSVKAWGNDGIMHEQRLIYDPVNRKILKRSIINQKDEDREGEMLDYLKQLLNLL